jgi:hypothetical protein
MTRLKSESTRSFSMSKADIRQTILSGAIAGAAGGLAEVAWVTLCAAVTGSNAAIIAKGITTAAGISSFFPDAPVGVGVAVHMGLSLLLGVALAFAWRFAAKRAAAIGPYGFCLAALFGVWFANFFVILPLVSPGFIQLVSYPVSMVSKLLFGLAAAQVLSLSAQRAQQAVTARSRA